MRLSDYRWANGGPTLQRNVSRPQARAGVARAVPESCTLVELLDALGDRNRTGVRGARETTYEMI